MLHICLRLIDYSNVTAAVLSRKMYEDTYIIVIYLAFDKKLRHIEIRIAWQFASFNAKLDNPILEIRPVSFSQLLLQRSNLLIFRPGGGETAGFDITTFVQSYRLQT